MSKRFGSIKSAHTTIDHLNATCMSCYCCRCCVFCFETKTTTLSLFEILAVKLAHERDVCLTVLIIHVYTQTDMLACLSQFVEAICMVIMRREKMIHWRLWRNHNKCWQAGFKHYDCSCSKKLVVIVVLAFAITRHILWCFSMAISKLDSRQQQQLDKRPIRS